VRESRGKPHGEVRENPWMLLLKFLIGTPLLWLGTHLSLLWFGTHLSAMRRTHTPTPTMRGVAGDDGREGLHPKPNLEPIMSGMAGNHWLMSGMAGNHWC
jgi:hypothetical protein